MKAEEHCLLFGGDQLTAARAQQNVMNTDEDHKNLLGITPVVEDWHTTCFLQVVIELIISIDSYFFVYTPTLQPVSMVLSTK